MPHAVVEFSANLEEDVTPAALVAAVHEALARNPAFDLPAIRTRAVRCEHFRIADGDPRHAFVAVTVRIGPGRDVATRKAASAAIMASLSELLAPSFERRGLGLSVEVTELDDAGMSRKMNLRDLLARNPAPSAR